MVEIKAGTGEHQVSVKVHEALLRHYSGYFESALGGNFAEANSGVIDFQDEEEADIVKRFVLWLYTKEYNAPVGIRHTFDVICKLWVFGDKRQIPLLSNMMINKMRDEMVRLSKAPSRCLMFIYENTTAESKLRAFVVWLLVATGVERMLTKTNRESWPGDASFDLLQAVVERKGAALLSRSDLASFNLCQWHQHEGDENLIILLLLLLN